MANLALDMHNCFSPLIQEEADSPTEIDTDADPYDEDESSEIVSTFDTYDEDVDNQNVLKQLKHK